MTDPPGPYRWLSPDFLSELFRDPLDPGYADAAARRRGSAEGKPSPGRHATRAVFLVSVVAVGLLFAVAYRQVVAEEPTRAQIRADLEEQIHERTGVTETLQADADRLNDEVRRLRDEELGDPEEVRRLRELEAIAGVARVTGDGAEVRVEDGPPGVDPATGEPDLRSRILDRDLQVIANGLWAAGAEAIAVNDRRLTATSTIRTASGAILVDRVPVAGPYRVVAIGPDDLAERFAGSPAGRQLEQLVDEFGIGYQVRAEDGLTLPAATGTPQLYHATPTGGDS